MSDTGLFDEPSISRQWVLRRLQQVLTTDLAAGAFARGLGRFCAAAERPLATELAVGAETRAATVRELILDEGGTPYQSIGLARACSRLGGTVAGPLALVWRPGLRLLATHTLQEYETLVAHLRTAPGISAGLAAKAEPLFRSAQHGYAVLHDR
jgi:hypothetical protein